MFKLAKQVFEEQLSVFCEFLQENLMDYIIPKGNVDILKKHYKQVLDKLDTINYKQVDPEELYNYILLEHWRVILSVDNVIDSSSKKDQSKILKELIASLKTNNKFSKTSLPKKTIDIVNTKILVSDEKVQIAIDELTSELNLLNPKISWIEALKERARIASNTYLLAIDFDKAIFTLKKLFYFLNKYSFVEKPVLEKYRQELESLNIKIDPSYPNTEHPCDNHYTEKSIEENVDLIREKLSDLNLDLSDTTLQHMIKIGCFHIIIHSIIDDYLDIVEDLTQNKITGIIQGMKQSISPRQILGTVVYFLQSTHSENYNIDLCQKWTIEILKILYHDTDVFLDTLKDIDPRLFEYFFQRRD